MSLPSPADYSFLSFYFAKINEKLADNQRPVHPGPLIPFSWIARARSWSALKTHLNVGRFVYHQR